MILLLNHLEQLSGNRKFKLYFTGANIGEMNVSWKERHGGTSKFNLIKECNLNLLTFLRVYLKKKIKI